MSEMVRKQIYIHERHQLLLERLAQARGVSQAEVIRQAIEREVAGKLPQSLQPDGLPGRRFSPLWPPASRLLRIGHLIVGSVKMLMRNARAAANSPVI